MSDYVVISVGHQGRASKPTDRGAVAADGGSEVDGIWRYTLPLIASLRCQGIDTFLLTHGSYRWRHEQVGIIHDIQRRADPDCEGLALECHLNAGPPTATYALTGHDARSSAGRMAAHAIAAHLREDVPAIDRAVVKATTGDEAGDDRWLRNVHATIAGYWDLPSGVTGVCLEPYFLTDAREIHDDHDHNHHVAHAIASGVVAYFDARRA